MRAGWQLELDVPEARADDLEPEAIPLDIVYEDDDVIVVDKPAGLVTHPSPGHASGTLANALLALPLGGGAVAPASAFGTIAGVERPGIVHRLDRDTSGLLMVARNDAAQASLQAQLKARRVRKTYLGLVGGVVDAQLGRIEKPIGRDARNRLRMAVTADGRPAVTGYRVRERFARWTLLELDLVTGRTHQIRVHLASIGHAIAGDPVYANGGTRRGPDGLERLFLHAWRLEFVSPGSGRLVRCEAPLPDGLERVLEALRAGEEWEGLTIRAIHGEPGAQLVIISGPSGVGKDTIIEAMRRRAPAHPRHYVITVTTRARRQNEVAGPELPLRLARGLRAAARGGRPPRGLGGPRQLVWHAARPGPVGARGGARRHPEDRRPGRPQGTPGDPGCPAHLRRATLAGGPRGTAHAAFDGIPGRPRAAARGRDIRAVTAV